jgi:hypothetical protein
MRTLDVAIEDCDVGHTLHAAESGGARGDSGARLPEAVRWFQVGLAIIRVKKKMPDQMSKERHATYCAARLPWPLLSMSILFSVGKSFACRTSVLMSCTRWTEKKFLQLPGVSRPEPAPAYRPVFTW